MLLDKVSENLRLLKEEIESLKLAIDTGNDVYFTAIKTSLLNGLYT